MRFVLDTSVLIALERNDPQIISRLNELSKLSSGPPQVTIISRFELLVGLNKKEPKNKQKAIELLNKFTCISATARTADILAHLKQTYDEKGISISLADLLIASQVKEYNLTLITKDNDFEKIKEINKIIL